MLTCVFKCLWYEMRTHEFMLQWYDMWTCVFKCLWYVMCIPVLVWHVILSCFMTCCMGLSWTKDWTFVHCLHYTLSLFVKNIEHNLHATQLNIFVWKWRNHPANITPYKLNSNRNIKPLHPCLSRAAWGKIASPWKMDTVTIHFITF